MGEIMELNYGSAYSRFDGNPENHYHFVCENCGRVFDLDEQVNKEIDKRIEKPGFPSNITGLSFMVYVVSAGKNRRNNDDMCRYFCR